MLRAHTFPQATISAGDDGNTLPQTVIDCNENLAAAGFASSGTTNIQTDAGIQQFTYTGLSGDSFTGCSGGTGQIHTNYAVGMDEIQAWHLNWIQDKTHPLNNGAWLGRPPAIWCTDGSTLECDAFQGVVIGGQSYAGSALSVVSGSLTANTWYYVYLVVSGSSLLFSYSTTAPDATHTFLGGDPTGAISKYVAAFRTNNSSIVLPFRYRSGQYLYRWSDTASGIAGLSGIVGTTGGSGTVALTGASGGNYGTLPMLPPHVRIALLQVDNVGSSTSTLGTAGDGPVTYLFRSGTRVGNVWIETNSSQQVRYISNASTTLTVYTMGFQDYA